MSVIIVNVRLLLSVLYNVKLNDSLFTRVFFFVFLLVRTTLTHIHLTRSSDQLPRFIHHVGMNCLIVVILL